MTPCPSCRLRWSNEESLAVHLMDDHGLDAQSAVNRARATFRDAAMMARRVRKKAKGAR